MTSTIDKFYMPADYGKAEFTEKKSRFISRVWPVETEEKALEHIEDMRSKHYDATHNVYAYSIKNTGIVRFSDDGEPQGTSGIPALGVFQNENIDNFCCVITRYYGGIQLGAGGLLRAYSKAAKMGLDEAGISLMTLWDKITIPCDYTFYDRLKLELENMGAIIENSEFTDLVLMTVLSPVEKTEEAKSLVQNISSGSSEIKKTDRLFQGVKIK